MFCALQLIYLSAVGLIIISLVSNLYFKADLDQFLFHFTVNPDLGVPIIFLFLQNSLIILAIAVYLHKRVKSSRLTKTKLEWLKNRIFQQVHSKESQILSKMVESEYLYILAYEWVDEFGQHVQVRNCHRVTRNYFKNSGAFVKKMKRKIRKKLLEISFSSFNKFFEKIANENKKFNIFDSDDLFLQNLSLQPNPENFLDRNNNFNLNAIDRLGLREDQEEIEHIPEIEDYPENFDDQFELPEEAYPESVRAPALPKIKVHYENNKPVLPKLDFMGKADLEKKGVVKQLMILYSEINEISLAIETKLQFLKLDFHRKFYELEFEEYSKRKFKIDKKLRKINEEISSSLAAENLKISKKFESEKESLIPGPSIREFIARDKKKSKRKNREGRRFFKGDLYLEKMEDRKLHDCMRDKKCTICLDNINDNVVMFKCKHFFHYSCIFTWLFEKNYCPLCKKQLLRHN